MSDLIFQNYHKHTYWSNIKVADSATSIEDYCKRAVELGHGIISSVEHGWQGHYIECHQLAEKYGLKFLFGTEAYWVKDRLALDENGHKDGKNCHICLLAMNENGRQAINDILSQAAIDGYYRQSRIDLDLILSLPADDVVVTSACIQGWAYEDSDSIFLRMKEHFGNNFYLEVQYHNTEPQKRLNKHILKLKKQYGFQIIMGCDSHYIDEKGALDRDEFIKSKGMNYPDEEGWYMDYPDGQTAYKRFAEQCVLSHNDIIEAMNNTNRFLEVEEYDCPIFNHDIKMPTLYPELTQEERDAKLEELIWDKWNEYKAEVPAERWSEYEEQIRYELDIVKTTFHSDYFLLDYAITQLGKEKGGQLTLTGRGSAVSFVLNKLLGFTSVDRVAAKVKMYPERFMSPTRILETHSLADIDMNVATQEPFWEAQEELLGFDHSKQMVAFQQLKPAAAWKMYAKSQNVDFDTANEVSKQIGKYLKDYAKAKEEADDDEEIDIDILDYIDKQYQDIYMKSTDYLGVISAITPHASASLVYQGNIRKEIGYIFVKSQSGEGHLCCCMDGKWGEKYGFLKNDWLKVNVVEVIYKIFERIGMEPFSSTELIKKCETDSKPWALYKKQCTKGLNQVEQPSSSTKVGTYAPTNISELTAFVAAVRPGFKSMYDIFESRKHFDYGIPTFDKLLQTDEMPNSFVLYQEQAMLTLNYAGIPMSECYAVIKAISKKRVNEITKNKPIFIDGFKKRIQEDEGISETQAEETAYRVWQIIEDGSQYSFNCVAGTTRLFRDKSRTDYAPTIEEMYKIKHDLQYAKDTNHLSLHSKYINKRFGYGTCHSLCDNNTKVKKNDIVDIYYMGEKQTYRVTTKSGCVIECTEDHKFPTRDGNKELNELKVGDKLFKKGLYEKCKTNYTLTNGNFENNFPQRGQCGFQKREDGDSVLFSKFRTICKEEKRCCEDCGREYSDDYRFEVHHEDFDRTNNSFENYAWLCVSCHKKRHYANGRLKKSDKGYPVIEDEIISIEDAGVQSVYDIEMADPNHTFTIDNGLIVCNCSHAYSVGLDSLYEAWLKCHYPFEFYETYLNILVVKNKNRYNRFKEEAEHYFNIKFPPFRFRQDNRAISIDKEHNSINNALSSIKGYSNQIAGALYDCGHHCRAFIDVLKYLDERSIKSAKIIPLIKIGYFDEFGNENSLLKFVEYWDLFKQGTAKQMSKDKIDDLLNRLLPFYATDKNKDGSEAKSWKLIPEKIYNLLDDILIECVADIKPPTYKDKMKWQNEILGYIELTTGKKEDTKRILILDVKPLVGSYSPEPWCYKVETRSIGTGKTASLNIDAKTWNSFGELAPMNIIDVGRVGKNKKGYWYIYDYEKECV